MARSKETFNKRDKEKKRLKQKQDKKERLEERRANAGNKSFEDMIAYVDENGNFTSTPPDPSMRKLINAEEIELGVPKHVEGPEEKQEGVINFFNESKGYGFILNKLTQEKFFFHVNNLTEQVKENDKVKFDTERSPKGMTAINIEKIK